jgi:hypothetical protein
MRAPRIHMCACVYGASGRARRGLAAHAFAQLGGKSYPTPRGARGVCVCMAPASGPGAAGPGGSDQ